VRRHPPPAGPDEVFTFSMGPLKGDFFLFAKTRPDGKPGEGGGTAPKAELPSLTLLESSVSPPVRTTRMLEGNEDDVGVAGSTLTLLLCGDLVSLWLWLPATETAGEVMDTEDVDEALECEWWW
jgi:hypothetical protein